MLAAIDFETTGLVAGWHEPIQIAIVPLGDDLEPCLDERFYWRIRPNHPERASREASETHRLDLDAEAPDAERVADYLIDWINRQNRLCIKSDAGRVYPLCHNWAFESAFFQAWLGQPLVNLLFGHHAADTVSVARAINDRERFYGRKIKFPRLSLNSLCKQLGVVNDRPHDALEDAVATARVYRRLLIQSELAS
jgi:DNA polymerase III epsilon subunit-like protein